MNYRLHDWCISRQRYWGPPIPIIYCDDRGAVPVPEKDLPVLLPFVEDFKPDDSGISPLARHEEWYRVRVPKCGKMARRETDVSDTFLDSAWYFLRYPSVGIDDVAVRSEPSRRSGCRWTLHRRQRARGAASAVLAVRDDGAARHGTPRFRGAVHEVPRARTHHSEGAKMSKSQGNVVIPDEYIEKWGADAFRTYLMFLGPFEEGGDFRDAEHLGREALSRPPLGIGQSRRCHRRRDAADPDVMRKLHQTIRKVGEDIPRLSYNTAVAAMMEYMNVLRRGERAPHARRGRAAGAARLAVRAAHRRGVVGAARP